MSCPVPRLVLGLCLAALASATGSADAVVVSGRNPITPSPGWVARFNGSSAVPISAHWLITARHVAGSVGQIVTVRGVEYTCAEIREHPFVDVQLIRVTQPLPGWHRLAAGVEIGDPAIIGGWGVTAGDDIEGGFAWNGPCQETWGANTIEGTGWSLSVRFDPPISPEAVPHESIPAVNDSGSGLFVSGADGQLELAGVTVSVTNFGSSLYGDFANFVDLSQLSTWIKSVIEPNKSPAARPRAPEPILALRWRRLRRLERLPKQAAFLVPGPAEPWAARSFPVL